MCLAVSLDFQRKSWQVFFPSKLSLDDRVVPPVLLIVCFFPRPKKNQDLSGYFPGMFNSALKHAYYSPRYFLIQFKNGKHFLPFHLAGWDLLLPISWRMLFCCWFFCGTGKLACLLCGVIDQMSDCKQQFHIFYLIWSSMQSSEEMFATRKWLVRDYLLDCLPFFAPCVRKPVTYPSNQVGSVLKFDLCLTGKFLFFKCGLYVVALGFEW